MTRQDVLNLNWHNVEADTYIVVLLSMLVN